MGKKPANGPAPTGQKKSRNRVARALALRAADSFWQARYYDFDVWSERRFVEKLRYIHRNPVERGLVKRPEDWLWSSFRHYITGADGVVEIESQWTAQRGKTVRFASCGSTLFSFPRPPPSLTARTTSPHSRRCTIWDSVCEGKTAFPEPRLGQRRQQLSLPTGPLPPLPKLRTTNERLMDCRIWK